MNDIEIEDFVRNVYDFPKKGVVFKDITPLLRNPQITQKVLQQLIEPLKGLKIDKVAGIESRGFLFGMLLAQALQVGFIPVRKPGKLPAETISESYDLEYGHSSLEIHTDVLATGGTALAAAKLVERLGGEVVRCSFLMEIAFLKGREKLHKYQINSILNY